MQSSGLTFRVFVSSTFSDLKVERNALQERVFPRLRDLCASLGARFQAIDLRWGVSEEASLDQQAVPICLAEIQRCQRVTPRPNFVVLLGDRYGWQPLPAEIPASEFEPIRHNVVANPAAYDALTQASRQPALVFLDDWYRRDDNAVPVVYILQPRQGEFEMYRTWEAKVERPLRAMLRRATQDLNLSPEARLKYEASATHQEIESGSLQVPDSGQHVHCFCRTIQGLPADDSAKDYRDLVDGRPDADAEDALQALKTLLRERLPGNVHEYVAVWQDGQISSDHLKEMCDHAYAALAGVIRQQVVAWKGSSPPEQEVATQAAFLAERAADFTGRAGDLRAIADYLGGNASQPLSILGAPGSGKSALLARAIQRAQTDWPDALFIFRFIGVTPASSNGQNLLRGLCEELYERLGLAAQKEGRLAALRERGEEGENARRAIEAEYAIPEDPPGLADTLRRFLGRVPAGRRIFLFMDALDQLDLLDAARRLAWLPGQLPSNARLVISAATDAEELVASLRARLADAGVRTLAPMSRGEGELLLDRWLVRAGRALQLAQRTDILDKFARHGLPLYLRLAFDQARRWHSYEGLPGGVGLGVDIPGIVADLFERLSRESEHGQKLVSRSLGYLAASRYGLAEDELLDLLSRDVAVYSWFFKSIWHTPPDLLVSAQGYLAAHRKGKIPAQEAGRWLSSLRADGAGLLLEEFLGEVTADKDGPRLPVVLWSRLHHDLEPYLARRAADGVPILGFYHRQLREVAERTYLSSADQRRERHTALAAYFDSRWRRPDTHALSELPYHQGAAGQSQAYCQTLLTYAFLRAKVETLGVQRLLADYDLAEALSLPLRPDDGGALRLVGGTLDLSTHVLRRDPAQLPSQLSGRLLPGAESELQALLSDIRRETTSTWLRPLSPALTPPGGPQLRTLMGHTGKVICVAMAADGRWAVSGAGDGTLKVWDLATGECLRTFRGHTSGVAAVAVTADGRWAVSGSWDTTLKVWDLVTGECLCTLAGHTSNVGAVAVTPDGRCAVSGSLDRTLRVWDLATGECLRALTRHGACVEAVAVTPDGRCAVSGSWDKRLRVWDLTTGKCLRTLTGHRDQVNAVAVTPDGRWAVSGSSDNTLRVWDLATGRCLRTLAGHRSGVTSVAVTADGRAFSGSSDDTLRVWTLATGECLRTLAGYSGGVRAVAVTVHGQSAVSGSGDSMLRVWDLTTAECLRPLTGHSSNVSAVVVTPDGRRGVSGSWDETLRVWDLVTGECQRTLTGHTSWVQAVAVTPDGRWTVSGSLDKTLRVWGLATGDCLHTLKAHTDGVAVVAVTPDGRLVVSGSWDKTLRVWDLATGECLRTLKGHKDVVGVVAVTLDGRRAVSADGPPALSGWQDKTLRVWDLATGECLRTLTGHSDVVKDVAATPDGRWAVSGSSDNTLRVWDLATGDCLRTLKGHTDGVLAVAVTPDGQRVVSGAGDHDLRVWDLATGECLHTLTGHTSFVEAVAVTADGRRAVSASWDNTLRVWDLATGVLVASFEGAAPMSCSTRAPDDRIMVGGGLDGCLHLLCLENVEPGRPLVTAARLWHADAGWDAELSAACPRCGLRFAVTEKLLGTEMACAHCSGALRVNHFVCDHRLEMPTPLIPVEQPPAAAGAVATPYVIRLADLAPAPRWWLAIPLALTAAAWALTRLAPRPWLCAALLLIQAALGVAALLVVRLGTCPSCHQLLVVLPGQDPVKCLSCRAMVHLVK